MRPDEWNQLLVDDKFLFPMPAAGDFVHPFIISHAGERQSMVIEKAPRSKNFRQKGTFREHPEHKEIFTVAIWPGEGRMGTTDPSSRPPPGARVVVEVPTPTFELDGETHEMRGEISQDIFRTKADMNAIVRGPAKLLEQSHLYSRPRNWTKNDFRICLRREDDPTFADRHPATVDEIGEGQERTDGLDISASVPDSLAAELIPEHLRGAQSKKHLGASGQRRQDWLRRVNRDGRRGGGRSTTRN